MMCLRINFANSSTKFDFVKLSLAEDYMPSAPNHGKNYGKYTLMNFLQEFSAYNSNPIQVKFEPPTNSFKNIKENFKLEFDDIYARIDGQNSFNKYSLNI